VDHADYSVKVTLIASGPIYRDASHNKRPTTNDHPGSHNVSRQWDETCVSLGRVGGWRWTQLLCGPVIWRHHHCSVRCKRDIPSQKPYRRIRRIIRWRPQLVRGHTPGSEIVLIFLVGLGTALEGFVHDFTEICDYATPNSQPVRVTHTVNPLSPTVVIWVQL